MATLESEPAAAACPYLGILDDPKTRFLFVSAAHRCHVGRRPATIGLDHQARLCLTESHADCPRYRPWAGPASGPRPFIARPTILSVVETTRPASNGVDPTSRPSVTGVEPAGRVAVTVRRRVAIAGALAAGLLLVVSAVIWIALTGGTAS